MLTWQTPWLSPSNSKGLIVNLSALYRNWLGIGGATCQLLYAERDQTSSSNRRRRQENPLFSSYPGGAFSAAPACWFFNSFAQLDHLVALFPDMDKQFLGKAFNESGDEMDSAIKRLNELKLSVAEIVSDIVQETNIQFSAQGAVANSQSTATRGESSRGSSLPVNGAEWVEFLVGQVLKASHIEDARERVAQALESLQKSICENVITGVQSFQKESLMQKQQQLGKLLDEKTILKRAVSVQNERQEEFEEMGQEMLRLKQLVVQYQEQVRTLETNNYVLTVHLRQAQQNNSIPGRFKPDVF